MKATILVPLIALLFPSALAVEDNAALQAAMAERTKEARARQEPLALELESMLGDETKITLYSIEPNENYHWRAEGKKDGIDIFRDRPIRGSIAISDRKEAEALVRALIARMRESHGTVLPCFIPHHGLKIERGQKKIDLLICFGCLEGIAYGAYAANGFPVTDAPEAAFNDALTRHKLPLPRSPNQTSEPTAASGRGSP